MIRFRVGHDDGNGYLYFEVRVFESQPEMMAHFEHSPLLAGREPRQWFRDKDQNRRTQGMVCPRRNYSKVRGRYRGGRRIGVILLNRPHLSTNVVSHEVVHAAMTYYRETGRPLRTDRWRPSNFGPACGPREERFAYIYGSLLRNMTNKLYDKGLWKEAA